MHFYTRNSKKHRVQCQFGNLPAIKKQQRFIDYNLNRLFSGDHDQKSFEVQRASELKACTKTFLQIIRENIFI